MYARFPMMGTSGEAGSDVFEPTSPLRGPLAVVARQLRGPIVAAIAIVSIAAAGYVIIDGWGWLDAVYMAVITVGQVGYSETRPLTTGTKVWTIGVIAGGFAVFAYSAASITALFLSRELSTAVREARRARMRKQMHDHVVVAGFGRVGRAAVEASRRGGRACVVVDTDPSKAEAVAASGAVFLPGDARDGTMLRLAGIHRAVALITSLDDPSNAVVALTARSLAPSIRIVTRVTDTGWRDRLTRAGASHVVPVYESVGASLAATALDAEVIGVLPIAGTDMRVEEVEVGAGSTAEGLALHEVAAQCEHVHLLGLRRQGDLVRWHESGDALRSGDVLVVLGTAPALDRLTELVRHRDELDV